MEIGPARRLEVARRPGRRALGAVDDPQRAGRARGASGCSRTRTPRRAACRPTAATATTSTSCSPRAGCRSRAGALELQRDAPRGRRGDARHDRDALAGDQPARDRLGAADRHRHDPPRRGAAAPAAGRDGRRHHLHRRRDQARVHVRRAGRPRPASTGRRSYLNERARRASDWARGCCRRGSPTRRWRRRERAFLAHAGARVHRARATPPRTRSTSSGAARLLSEHRFQDLSQINELMEMLERRRGAARRAARRRSASRRLVRIGSENELPELRSLAVVAADYGLPRRNLGTVSVIGPVRMDYPGAISAVREAARELSRFVEDVYDEMTARDPYEVLGVARDADEHEIKKAFRAPRARAAPRRQRARPRGRGEVQGGRRGLRDPLRPRAPRDLRPLRPRGPALAAASSRASRASARSPTSSTRSSAAIRSARFGGARGAGRVQGGDVAVEVRDLARRGGGRRRRSRSRTRSSTPASAATATAPSRARRSRPARAAAAPAGCGRSRARRSARSCASRPATSAAARAASRASRARECDGRGRDAVRKRLEVDVPAGIADGQRIRLAGRGHAGERGGPPGDLYVLVRVAEDERFLRDGDDLVTVLDVPAPAAALGATRQRADARRRRGGRRAGRHAAGGRWSRCAAAGMPRSAGGRRGDLRVVVNVVIPRKLSARQRELLEELARLADRREPRERPTRRCVAQAAGGRSADPARRSGRPPSTPRACSPSCSSWRPPGSRRWTATASSSTPSTARPGELPALPDGRGRRRAARSSRSSTSEVPDDWAERWKRSTSRSLVGGRLRRAPAVEPSRATACVEIVIDPARRSAPARTHDAAVPRAAARARAAAAPSSTSAAAPACWRSPPRSSASRPSPRVDHEPAASRRRATTRAPTA